METQQKMRKTSKRRKKKKNKVKTRIVYGPSFKKVFIDKNYNTAKESQKNALKKGKKEKKKFILK